MATAAYWADTEAFQKALKAKGWSKSELARRVGMHASSITVISNRRQAAYPSQVERICKALGVKPSKLFTVA